MVVGLAGLLAAATLSHKTQAAEIVPVDLREVSPECGVAISAQRTPRLGCSHVR